MADPTMPTSRSTHVAPFARRTAGGVLFTVMILMLAAAIVGASVLNNALAGLRLAYRNDMRAQMTAVADAELEWLFFNVKMAIMSGSAAADITESTRISDQADAGTTPSTIRDVYLAEHRAAGWRVQRSVRHLLNTTGTDTSNGGSRRALLDYIEAKVIVLPPATGSYANLSPVRIGRYFITSQSTIFQYGIFFDGDLELNPGENYSIDGDIYASGNAFIAPLSGKTLTVKASAKLRLIAGNTLNGSDDPLSAGGTRYNPDAPGVGVTLADPFFALTGQGYPGAQLEELVKEENLLGGLDALATAQSRLDLFAPSGMSNGEDFPPAEWTEAEEATAINNVKRSLIVPPPDAASDAEYPNNPSTDDPSINVQRAYTRAGIIVTVADDGSVTVHQKNSSGTLVNVTSTYMTSGLISGILTPAIASSAPVSVYDAREGRNVKVTELNIDALKKKLGSSSDFNGLIYINLKNSTSAAPAAVRIINGESVPVTEGGTGLSVATNGGLYVKGSYNSTPRSDGTYPSSMLMADAITVLSYSWDDSNAAADVVTGRVASVDNPATVDNILTLGTVENVETEISINAGLVTGNSSTTGTHSSGGAQNLVRFLENWSGKTVNLYGSLGRVFQSAHFTRPFKGTADVYRAPNRNVTYDTNLASSPPAGSPILTSFSPGDIFRF